MYRFLVDWVFEPLTWQGVVTAWSRAGF